MTPPPSTPKKTRRITPKIIGHTSPTPRASGTGARSSLRTLAPASHHTIPSVRPPTGAPGMRCFPRARTSGPTDARSGRGTAVSVTLALREQAEAAAATAGTAATMDTTGTSATPTRRRTRKPAPARTAVVGRPTTPDERPLDHAPAVGRPIEPPLRTTVARSEKAPVAHRSSRRRVELGAPLTSRAGEPSARPRPSRVLAELHAALADEAAAAE